MRYEVQERSARGSFIGFAVYDHETDSDVAVFHVPPYDEQAAHYLALVSCHDYENAIA